MPFKLVRFSSFRNLADGELSLDADRVFFVGDNGQGKTNALEALYYLSFGSSFRGPVDAEVARKGSCRFALSGMLRSDASMPPDELSITWDSRVKEIRRDGKPVRDRKELIDLNPSVVFCHEDFSFAAGEPERRRFFFDQSASLVSAGYVDIVRDYKRILKQRNAALKEGRHVLLDLLDQQLAGKGIELMERREELHSEFDERFVHRFEAVSQLGDEVRICYRPSWSRDLGIEGVLEKLHSKRAEETALGTSLSGPHRDRWTFALKGEDFASTASTGQLRLLSLTLRMVQADYFTATTGRLPVLLLDDVLLELDQGRRKRFLDRLPPAGQSIFTFLPGEPWEEYRSGSTLVYEVRDGRFSN